MTIQLISGSNSSRSINKTLLSIIGGLIKDIPHELIDLTDYPLPIFSNDHLQTQGIPENVLRLRTMLSVSDGFIVSVPEHNGSIPAFFKNILDWMSRVNRDNYKVLQNKLVLLLSASPGEGGSSSVLHAGHILKRLGATVTDKVVVSNFYRRVGINNNNMTITDEALQRELMKAVQTFIHTIKNR